LTKVGKRVGEGAAGQRVPSEANWRSVLNESQKEKWRLLDAGFKAEGLTKSPKTQGERGVNVGINDMSCGGGIDL